MIDVEGMLRQASTRVRVDHLIKKGKTYIQVLSREKIDELINRSVRTIVAKHRVTAAHRHAASAAQIEMESKAEFQELLQQYQQTADAKSAVENSKRVLEEEHEEIRFELVPDRGQKEAPKRGDRRTEANGALEDFIRTLDKQVLRMFAVRKIILERSASPEAIAELSQVEDLLRTMLAKIFESERERFTAPAGDARELAMLRKRMDKLTAYIATLEAALKTLSTAKTFSNQQVQNLLRDLGLAPDDKNFEKKKEMLKVVLSATQGIRKKARELAARGITLDAPEEQAVFTPATEFHSDLFSRSSV
jgi:lipopolysaccharide biosynthesis regulator YciM